MNTLPLGSFASVSSPHEVVAALIGVLADYNPELSASYLLRFRDITPSRKAAHAKMIVSLVKALNRFCPPFTYVGHHLTDENVWGVWIDLGKLHEAEEQGKLVQVSNHEVDQPKAIYALEFNNKGVSLWRRKGNVRLWETQ